MTIKESPAASSSPRSLWRNANFLILWSGQTISTLGDQISALALPLLVLALTGSPAQAGLIAALEALPYLIVSLPAGALVDRWNRKVIMIICDVIRCLLLGSVPLAYVLGYLSVAQLYLIALVEGTAFVFFNIAQTSALPHVVSKEQLSQANALNFTVEWSVQLVGPGLSGFIISIARSTVIGATLAYFLDSISFLVSVLSLSFIRTTFQEERVQTQRRSLRREIIEGLHFLVTHPILRTMALITMSVNLFFVPTYLATVVLTLNVLHANASLIGIIFSLSSIGGILGSFIAPRLSKYLSVGHILIGSILVAALASLIIGIATTPLMVIVGSALIALTQPVYSVTQLTYRLKLVPDELQGRVNSAFRLLAFGMPPLGLAVSGFLLGLSGPRFVLALLAIGLFLSACIASFTKLRQA